MNRAEAAGQERVGPYRVVKAIGAGGSARIDLARVERAYGFERDIVLKRPLEHLRTSSAVATTLRREAWLGGRLRHPNVVAVLDAGQHDGYDYLALEYVRGVSLRAATETARAASGNGGKSLVALPLDVALSIVIGVANGLHFAHKLLGPDGHSLGLVHRDVSPGNVLIGFDGTVKLADFGIAKDTHVDTLSGSLRGTVTYMAPEQCRGHAFDRRADVFSLGVILHELITARRLFWAENDVASLHRVLSGAIPDPRELAPQLAPELAAIAMHALAPEAADRIASAKELAERLEAFASRAGIVTGARMIERALAPDGNPSTDQASHSARLTAKLDVEVTTEPSLVAVIHSAPDDAPVAQEAPPVPAKAPGRRRTLAIVMVAGIAFGVLVTIFVMREPSTPAPITKPAPPSEPSGGSAIAPPPVAEPAGSQAIAPPPVAEPAGSQEPAHEPVVAEPPKRADPPRSRPRVVRTEPWSGSAVPNLGSGSSAGSKPPKKVEWTPGMLLPSDTGSQRGSNR